MQVPVRCSAFNSLPVKKVKFSSHPGSDPEPVLPEEGGLRAAPDPQPAVQEGAPYAVRGPGEHQRNRQLSQGRALPLIGFTSVS